MFHWNATMTDLAELRNATHRWTREVLKSAHGALTLLETSVATQLDRWDAFVEDARRRVERAVVPALLTAQEMFAFLNYHVTRIQESVSGKPLPGRLHAMRSALQGCIDPDPFSYRIPCPSAPQRSWSPSRRTL